MSRGLAAHPPGGVGTPHRPDDRRAARLPGPLRQGSARQGRRHGRSVPVTMLHSAFAVLPGGHEAGGGRSTQPLCNLRCHRHESECIYCLSVLQCHVL